MTKPANAGAARFPIRIGRKSEPLLLVVFGVRPRNAYVDLSSTELHISFGYFHLSVPVSNMARWRIEGPWLWITAIGLRRGWSGDWTFGGTRGPGVRIDFHDAVKRSVLRIPRIYVTVEDLEGFTVALTALGIDGEDARRAQ